MPTTNTFNATLVGLSDALANVERVLTVEQFFHPLIYRRKHEILIVGLHTELQCPFDSFAYPEISLDPHTVWLSRTSEGNKKNHVHWKPERNKEIDAFLIFAEIPYLFI